MAQSPQGSAVAPPTLRLVQTVLDVSNEVAAELAGIGDGVLNALRDRLGCTVNLRGNPLTLAGGGGEGGGGAGRGRGARPARGGGAGGGGRAPPGPPRAGDHRA